METKPNSVFLYFIILITGLMFMLSCFIPFAGPAALAFLFGRTHKTYELYRVSTGHVVISALIGEAFFLLASLPLITVGSVISPKEAWVVGSLCYATTFILTIIFMKVGKKRSAL